MSKNHFSTKLRNVKFRLLKNIGSWLIAKSVLPGMKKRGMDAAGTFHKLGDNLFVETITTTKEPFISGMSMEFWKSTIYAECTDNQNASEESLGNNHDPAPDKALASPEARHPKPHKSRHVGRTTPSQDQTI